MKKIKILLDTSVIISYIGLNKTHHISRVKKAQEIISYLMKNNNYELCYSERTENELKNDKHSSVLNKFILLGSHTLNENWEQMDTRWENDKSKWGDIEELKLGENLENLLPDKIKKSNANDRGIYGDAICEGCNIILHENPKDFSKFEVDSVEKGILLINILKEDENRIIQRIENFLKKFITDKS